jgi:acetyltransferase-like isoleucine patch superfamily enzyme
MFGKIKRNFRFWMNFLRYSDSKTEVASTTYLRNVKLGRFCKLYENTSFVASELGDFSYIAAGTAVTDTTIGKFCSIGPECRIGLADHPTDMISTHPAFFSTRKQCGITFVDKDYFLETGKKIIIGNDVWIGSRAIIKSGIKIGDGAIIGAGAVVTRNVKPYSIVGGVPAKHIRFRFSETEIKRLQSSKWWDKDFDWFLKNSNKFRDKSLFNDLQ